MQPLQIYVTLFFIIVLPVRPYQTDVGSLLQTSPSRKVRFKSSRTQIDVSKSLRQRLVLNPSFFTDPAQVSPPQVPENGWARQLTRVGPGVFTEEDTSSRVGVTTWRTRSINTTLTCKEPGCEAIAQMQVFAEKEELVRNCMFALDVHPTDFDDRYSGERLEWVELNGVVVNKDCFPMVSACNESTQSTPFNCVRDVAISPILSETGLLTIKAKIPSVVDECPYKGNMLSAVSTVTCLVTPTYTTTTTTQQPVLPMNVTNPHAIRPSFVYRRSPIRCFHRNCTALTVIQTERIWLEMGGVHHSVHDVLPQRANYSKCLMNVMFFQTDFDQDDGTEELIDFIRVAGTVRKTKVAPGKNPCRQQWKTGVRPPRSEMLYTAIQDLDVTENVSRAWNISVEAKITPWVDECSYEGYLLNGFAELNCTIEYGSLVEIKS